MELSNIKYSDICYHSLNGLKTSGKVVRVYDGDTCSIVFYNESKLVKYRCRLMGINCPEIKCVDNETKEKGINARNYLISLVTDCKIDENIKSQKEIQKILDTNKKLIEIECFNFDKYGRLLVNIYCSENKCINEQILLNGHAIKYK